MSHDPTQKDELLLAFGKALKKKRLEAGISSQEKLAYLAGLDRTYIGGIEQGRRNPTLSSLSSIANALGISLSKLLQGVDE